MNLFLCIYSAIFYVAFAYPHIPELQIEPPPQCEDVSFACQNLETARLCDLVNTCMEEFWSISITDIDDICDTCKEIVDEARYQFLSNKSQVDVRNAMNGICEKWMIGNPEYCTDIVERFSMILQQTMADEMDFENLCSKIKVCPLAEKQTDMTEVENVNKGLKCDLCKDTINRVEKLLNDPGTKKNLQYLADQMCNALPKAMKTDCLKFSQKNIDVIYRILQVVLRSGTICPALRLCEANLEVEIVEPEDNNVICHFCKQLIRKVKRMTKNQRNKDQIKRALHRVCSKFPKRQGDKCSRFVNRYMDQIVNMLGKGMQPRLICFLIKVCPTGLEKSSTETVLRDVKCEICKEVTLQLKDSVEDKDIESKLKKLSGLVCSLQSKSMEDDCVATMKQNINAAIDVFKKGMDIDNICPALELCEEKNNEEYTEASYFLEEQS